MFLVGKIIGTHGIKGEVKVINESDFDRFVVGNKLFVYKDNKYVEIVIDSVRYHKNFVLISFNNHKNINEVLDYVHTNIYIDKHDESELEDGEYYYEDLIGCKTYTQDNEYIGIVKDILILPTQEVLEIERENGKIVMVPYVDAFMKDIDIENKTIIIEVIEGLI